MDYFTYKNGSLYAEDIDINELAKTLPTPFYCYSEQTLVRHYKVFAESFKDCDAQICYAIKANDNIAILQRLAQLGSGADAVSIGEIMRALKAGIPANKIVFSGVGKTVEELTFALNQDIMQINIESEAELLVLNDVAKSLNKKAPIAFRVNPDVDAKTHHKISTGRSHDKFGISYDKAREIYTKAASLPFIKVRAVAVHIGSQLTDLEPFKLAFTKIVELVKLLRNDGHDITHLDLGGGLGIPYSDKIPPSPHDYASMIKQVTKDLNCKLILEPGRLIVGNAGILVTKVTYVKKTENGNFLILDAGMNNLIRPALYDAYHQIIPVIQNETAANFQYDIVGPICETGDVFSRDITLPEIKAGDLIVIRSAGAYGSVMSSTYNTRALIAEIMVNSNKFKIIRKAQTIKELIERDIVD